VHAGGGGHGGNGNGHANGNAHANGNSNGHANVLGRNGGSPSVPLNIVDRGTAYLVRAALPGIRQEDVQVSVHGHTLTIRGQRQPDADSDDGWVIREYTPGVWERSMALPQEVESSRITASYEDGILELRLPKAGPTSRREVPITGSEPPASH
jgi:HSP20 family protein